jgi:hypothetical protein
MKRLFIITASLCLFAAVTCNASWLVFHKPEFKGKIVDIETNEPIEGAVVVAIYRIHALAVGDSVDMDVDARETLTDKNGKFTIPSYTTFINPLSTSLPVNFTIFKPGYVCNVPISLEEEFSGSGTRPDRDISVPWNQELKYRILKSGTVQLRRVSGNDRIESYRNMSWSHNLTTKLPIASKMENYENRIILDLKHREK